MVTVHRAFGFHWVIFTNDHCPPHVHVVGPGGEARITLHGPEGLVLDRVIGISRGDMRRIMGEAERERERLIAAWRRIHG